MLTKQKVAPVLAEFLGSGILVTITLVLAQTTGVSYFIATSVAVTLGLTYMFFGHVSGGHFNPAISIGMWTARRIGTLRVVSFIAAQLLGALAAWQLYQYFINQQLPAKTIPWDNRVFVAEVVGTAILAMGLASAVTRKLDSLQSALTYGASFFVGIMIAATASAGFLNPATALGLRSWGTVYVLGPVVGAIVGVNLYSWFFAPASDTKGVKSLKSLLRRR